MFAVVEVLFLEREGTPPPPYFFFIYVGNVLKLNALLLWLHL